MARSKTRTLNTLTTMLMAEIAWGSAEEHEYRRERYARRKGSRHAADREF